LDQSALVPNTYISGEFAQDPHSSGMTLVIKHSDLKNNITNLKNSLANSPNSSHRDLNSPASHKFGVTNSPVKAFLSSNAFNIKQCKEQKEDGELKEVFR